ncbi:hypothetical protein N9985_01755 [Gammaproteobacteria bacterium]|nr:hypothetical protein [Gammaproteobacteria bacterium]
MNLNDMYELMMQAPEYYFHKFDFEAGLANFNLMSRLKFRESTFLDSRIHTASNRQWAVPISDLVSQWKDFAPPHKESEIHISHGLLLLNLTQPCA